MSENGSQAVLEIGKHKTVSSAGRQLIDLRSTDYLVAHLLDYIHMDRPLLLQGPMFSVGGLLLRLNVLMRNNYKMTRAIKWEILLLA